MCKSNLQSICAPKIFFKYYLLEILNIVSYQLQITVNIFENKCINKDWFDRDTHNIRLWPQISTSVFDFEICIILPIPWVLIKKYSIYLGVLLRQVIIKPFYCYLREDHCSIMKSH